MPHAAPHASLPLMSQMPELDIETQCDCGVITLSVKGRVISMFQCSCSNCQTVSGSGHSSVVLVPKDAIGLVGATKSFARPADSGAQFTRHFCPECGTTLVAESSRAPAFRIIPAGLFRRDNEWFAPNQLIFARSHRHWDLIDPSLPRYQAYRPEKSP